MNQKITVLAKTSNDDLHLLLFNAIAAGRRAVKERERMQSALVEENGRLTRELAMIKMDAERKAALKRLHLMIAVKILLLMAFSFGCTISAVACVLYGIWWAAIAPVAFLLYGLWKVVKKGL